MPAWRHAACNDGKFRFGIPAGVASGVFPIVCRRLAALRHIARGTAPQASLLPRPLDELQAPVQRQWGLLVGALFDAALLQLALEKEERGIWPLGAASAAADDNDEDNTDDDDDREITVDVRTLAMAVAVLLRQQSNHDLTPLFSMYDIDGDQQLGA